MLLDPCGELIRRDDRRLRGLGHGLLLRDHERQRTRRRSMIIRWDRFKLDSIELQIRLNPPTKPNQTIPAKD